MVILVLGNDVISFGKVCNMFGFGDKSTKTSDESSAHLWSKQSAFQLDVALDGAAFDDLEIDVSGHVVSVTSQKKQGAQPSYERYFRLPYEVEEEIAERRVDGDMLILKLRAKEV